MKSQLTLLFLYIFCFVQAQEIKEEKCQVYNLTPETLWSSANAVKAGNTFCLPGVSFAKQLEKTYRKTEDNVERYTAQLPVIDSNKNWPGHLIEGSWIMPVKNGSIGETWEKVDENYYQNKGFMIKGKDTIVTERVALRNTADGIFYISTVENQNNKQPISFRLTSANNNIFIFENPGHDFPKRIVYEFTDRSSLHAYIDDGPQGKKREHFYYKKIK